MFYLIYIYGIFTEFATTSGLMRLISFKDEELRAISGIVEA